LNENVFQISPQLNNGCVSDFKMQGKIRTIMVQKQTWLFGCLAMEAQLQKTNIWFKH